MFPGPEHRRDSDSRSADVRARSADSGLWHRGLGRDRSGRESVRGLREAEHLLRTDGHQDETGLHGTWDSRCRDHDRQRAQSPLKRTLLLLALLWVTSCGRQSLPQSDFDHAYKNLVRGQLAQCRYEASRGYSKFLGSNPQWALRFKILEARALLEQGQFDKALRIVERQPPISDTPDLVVSATVGAAVAKIHMRRLPEAEQILNQALQQFTVSEVASCGDLFQALGILAD